MRKDVNALDEEKKLLKLRRRWKSSLNEFLTFAGKKETLYVKKESDF